MFRKLPSSTPYPIVRWNRNGWRWLGFAIAVVSFAPVAGVAQGRAPACDVESAKKELAGIGESRLAQLFTSAFKSSNCASVRTVMLQVARSGRIGGRKLEPDRPLDMVAARAERQAAAADSVFVGALADELKGETDPLLQLLREAAVLHDFGHYKARDAVLGRLREGAAP